MNTPEAMQIFFLGLVLLTSAWFLRAIKNTKSVPRTDGLRFHGLYHSPYRNQRGATPKA